MEILIGIAWPYVNGDLHVGHLAGYLLPADICARYHRIKGDDVLMVSGSDCHGTPITIEADKKKKLPGEIVKSYHKRDIKLFELYGFSYNLYTKTTTENHKKVVHDIFLRLLLNGYIVKDFMKQYYSQEDKKFLPDRYVEGICPHCHAKEQRSDQCEACGRWLEDGELLNPVSKLTGSKVALKDTEHYFLAFDKLEKKLRPYLDSVKTEWRKWIWAEADSWLNEGLKRRAITRDLDWGIDLPVDEIKKLPPEKQLKDFTGKKIYVWFEAVIGYLSAAIEWSKRVSGEIKGNPEEIIFKKYPKQSASWRDFWKNKSAKHYYFMGQDNLVFHTLMLPAQLMGVNEGYTLPTNIVVNKFMNYEGKKFSKSRNWIVDSREIADTYGVDLVRYYIASNLPENKEGNFTWEGFVETINNELVANIGNFIHRTLSFIENKFGGVIPEGKIENQVLFEIRDTFQDTKVLFSKMKFVETLSRIGKLAAFGNRYFDKRAVWKVVKEDRNEAGTILYNCVQIIEGLRVLFTPYIPFSMKKLSIILGQKEIQGLIGHDQWSFEKIKGGQKLGKVEVLFKKLEPGLIKIEKAKLGSKKSK